MKKLLSVLIVLAMVLSFIPAVPVVATDGCVNNGGGEHYWDTGRGR